MNNLQCKINNPSHLVESKFDNNSVNRISNYDQGILNEEVNCIDESEAL